MTYPTRIALLAQRHALTNHQRIGWAGILAVVAGACAGPLTHRVIEEPKGTSYELGTPKNRTFFADVAVAHDQVNLRVYEVSECDRIRVRVVARIDESLVDDEVVERTPLGASQVAEDVEGIVPCNDRYARNVEVALQAGSATYILGRTDRFGELNTNLSTELKQGLYGEGTPELAALLVERIPSGQVSLAELKNHEQRVAALVSEFKTLLDQPSATPADISRSYVIYEQLQDLSSRNAEVRALTEHFFELIYKRKAEESHLTLKRNLQALSEAKGVLAALGTQSIPGFVRVAVSAGELSPEVLQWAQGQVALSVRSKPGICGSPFRWEAVTGGAPSPSRLAFTLARAAYDDGFAQQIQALCRP